MYYNVKYIQAQVWYNPYMSENTKEKELVPVSARIPSDVYEKLVEDARENERSLTGEIVYALRQYIARLEYKREFPAGE